MWSWVKTFPCNAALNVGTTGVPKFKTDTSESLLAGHDCAVPGRNSPAPARHEPLILMSAGAAVGGAATGGLGGDLPGWFGWERKSPRGGVGFIVVLAALGLAIWVLILLCRAGDAGANRFGDPAPRAPG